VTPVSPLVQADYNRSVTPFEKGLRMVRLPQAAPLHRTEPGRPVRGGRGPYRFPQPGNCLVFVRVKRGGDARGEN
jgi:hypothetical protein